MITILNKIEVFMQKKKKQIVCVIRITPFYFSYFININWDRLWIYPGKRVNFF